MANPKLYDRKKRWKLLLFVLAASIVAASLYYTNRLVRRIAIEERDNARIWANAIERRAELVNSTEIFFNQLKERERDRVELFARVYRLIFEYNTNIPELYTDIITNNKSIPVIIADANQNIISQRNLSFPSDTNQILQGELLAEFSEYDPIEIPLAGDQVQYLYYQNSTVYRELKQVIDGLINSFFVEVSSNAASVPVIITDSTQENIIHFGNLDDLRMLDPNYATAVLKDMKSDNVPIEIDFLDQGKTFIFYSDSELLIQLQYFPLVQFVAIGLFLFIAYMFFSYARKAEQNQVWAGMAKETAHQIGTPLSSIMAWIELMKMQGSQSEGLDEIQQDVDRMEVITERFSKIGSPSKLKPTNVQKVIRETLEYLRIRTSKKIQFITDFLPDDEPIIPLNANLFSWVIENLVKNAIDAMEGSGTLHIKVQQDNHWVIIDLTDTGKGISKSMHQTIFNPGYTSKQRGWGLGLSLARRIIKDHHKGKIFVKSSSPGKGSTFCIQLKKAKTT